MPKRVEGPISKAQANEVLGKRRKEHQEYLDKRVPNIPGIWPNDPAKQAESYRGAKGFAERKTNEDRLNIAQKLASQDFTPPSHPPPSIYDDQVLARYRTHLAQAAADPEWRRAQIRATQGNLSGAKEHARLAGNDVAVLGGMNSGGYVPMTRAPAQAMRAAAGGAKPYEMLSTWLNETGVQQAYLRMLMSRLSAGASGGVRRM